MPTWGNRSEISALVGVAIVVVNIVTRRDEKGNKNRPEITLTARYPYPHSFPSTRDHPLTQVADDGERKMRRTLLEPWPTRLVTGQIEDMGRREFPLT